jgi:hypothetical protein
MSQTQHINTEVTETLWKNLYRLGGIAGVVWYLQIARTFYKLG